MTGFSLHLIRLWVLAGLDKLIPAMAGKGGGGNSYRPWNNGKGGKGGNFHGGNNGGYQNFQGYQNGKPL